MKAAVPRTPEQVQEDDDLFRAIAEQGEGLSHEQCEALLSLRVALAECREAGVPRWAIADTWGASS